MDAPRLIIFCGLPGTGKSAVAEGVSRHLKMPLFSVDPIESAIVRSGIESCFATGLAAYMIAETLADEQLKLGQSPIIDAVNSVMEAREMWFSLARKHEAKLVVIECICSVASLHRQRLAARVRNIYGIAEVTWDDVEARRSEYLVWDEPTLVLDSIDNIDANIAKAIEYVRRS
jgi:predicted kinase